MNRYICILCFLFILSSCTHKNQSKDDGLNSFSETGLASHIKTLASDAFEGRRPFTEGENKTLQYLETEMKKVGLEPGNGTGYLQDVPMVEITPHTDSLMSVAADKKHFTLKGFDDYVLNTQRTDSSIVWKNERVVFAGYGIVAPEYEWDDYAGLDVKDKVVMVLVNDPGFGSGDSTFFKGNTMTYYGRWTYKYEEAARHGAKGCLVIHNTKPAGYPFAVLQSTWNAPHLYLDLRDKSIFYAEAVGWITNDATEKLFSAAGRDFKKAKELAMKRGFKGSELKLDISLSLHPRVRYDQSHNVIGKISGSEAPDEYILYSAHWDHLGVGKKDATGDSIYNGAIDNASGTAALLEIAKAFQSMKTKAKRSVLFLAVTAEEQGLWGSAYYAANPIYPKEKTVANINMDGISPFGKMKDVMVIGWGQSDLDELLMAEARQLGRDIEKDDEPEKGYYFRSDHFNFAKIGIPALYLKIGSDFVGKGKKYGDSLKVAYTEKYYHQPSDEYDTTRLNFAGGVEDMKLLFQVGKKLSSTDVWPKWKEGSEFKAVREAYKK
jgi:Zn-dependent M28 family amino/carboxypeptidase